MIEHIATDRQQLNKLIAQGPPPFEWAHIEFVAKLDKQLRSGISLSADQRSTLDRAVGERT